MKVVLDNIIFSLQAAGGISSYWFELVRRLLPLNPVFVERDDAKENCYRRELDLTGSRIGSRALPAVVDRYLPVARWPHDRAIFHSSYYRYSSSGKALNVTTVHDFTYERFRNDPVALLHKAQKRAAVRHSKAVICVSRNTYDDFRSRFPSYRGLVEVIYHGISTSFRELDLSRLSPQTQSLSRSSGRRIVLFVGSRTSYKNFWLVVEALRGLQEYRLFIVGGGPLAESDRGRLEQTLPQRYHFLGTVSAGTLNELYNIGHCLVYPSRYEGFGLPVGEAMKAGCPVITTNVSSIPEVGGDAVLYLDDFTPESVVRCLKVLENERVRSGLIAAGRGQAEKFSWQRAADETKELYGMLDNHG